MKTIDDTPQPRRTNALSMWVIYDHPKDYPNSFVLREWIIEAGTHKPTGRWCVKDTLEECRAELPAGVVNIGRYPEDDPCIAEVWV